MGDYNVTIKRWMIEVDGKDRPLSEDRFVEALWKTVCGYWNGHTMQNIMRELGFAETAYEGGVHFNRPTELGKKFLYHYYNRECAKAEFTMES